MITLRTGFMAALALAAGAVSSAAQTVFVNKAAAPGGDGTSWARAYDELDIALFGLGPGREVWVAAGSYRPGNPVAGFVLPPGTSLYGGFAGTETALDQRDVAANPTLLEGDLLGDDLPPDLNRIDNAKSLVAVQSGSGARVSGFTLHAAQGTAMWANDVNTLEVDQCTFDDSKVGLSIRGIIIDRVRVTGCTFRGHERGGLALNAEQFADLSIEGSLFEHNSQTAGGAVGVHVQRTAFVAVSGSSFRDNFATAGAGLYLYSSEEQMTASIEDSLFEGNDGCAGGGVCLYGGSLLVFRCAFRENHDQHPPPGCGIGTGGGAIRTSLRTDAVQVFDSSFVNSNRSLLWADRASSFDVQRSTLLNEDNLTPSITLDTHGFLSLENSVVWGASAQQLDLGLGSVTASYSDVRMGGVPLPGTGNIDADPSFRAPDDPHLSPASPCIDAGRPTTLQIGADLDRDSRLLDGDLDGTVRVDMGADEHGPIRLDVTGTPAPLATLTLTTTGTPGLLSMLWFGTPGLRFVPLAGTVFISPATAVRIPWAVTPSSVQVQVPAGVSGLFHLQELGYGPGKWVVSNYVPLSF